MLRGPFHRSTTMTKAALERYFADKPDTHAIFSAVAQRIEALGPSKRTVGKQISYGGERKFAWFWLYNVTGRNPQGILHLMLAIDRRIEDAHVRDISQIGQKRYNHQIVLRTLRDAKSVWLKKLVTAAYRYGQRESA